MKLVSTEMLTSISFQSLTFATPFSTTSKRNNQYKGQDLFLEGVAHESGILVVRYINSAGILRYNFKSIDYCLVNAARRVYEILTAQNAAQIAFSLIPMVKKDRSHVLDQLKKEYANLPLDNHFGLLKPWIDGVNTSEPPVDILQYRRPFMQHNCAFRFSFHDYTGRGGLYFIREKNIAEGTCVNAYLGKSTHVLPSRIRNKFYPNPHLYYREIPGVLEYYIAAIEIQPSMLEYGIDYQSVLKKFEDKLIEVFDTRDNKLGRKVAINIKTNDGYQPVLGDDEEGF